MKKTKRSAFTIVELVIVIAVIAVLSAVLIPTFGSIIESANKAVDTQLVAQINTVLAIEDVLGGGVNDAVEIQKIVKESGLKLQTKSKGQYIWYDIENKQAVLGGLDENGIVIEGNNARAAGNKGKFMPTASSPEKFLNGYLFISQESVDGFAEKICSLRNANSASEIDESLTAITEINSKAGQRLSGFMDMAAVITSSGNVISRHEDLSKARVAIASSNLTTVKDATIDALAGTSIYVVDLHSGVTKMEFTGGTTAKAKLEGVKGKADSTIYFYYNNSEIGVIDRTAVDGNISNLIKEGEIVVGTYKIEKIAYVKDDGTPIKDGDNQIKYDFNKTIVNNVLSGLAPYYAYNGDGEGTAGTVYEFVGYSFNSDGSNPIAIGTTDYELNEYDKLLFQGDGTEDTIYAVYNERSPDFKVTVSNSRRWNYTYWKYTETHSYYPAGVLTLMLADNSKIDEGEYYTNIVITSKDVVLDAAFLGEDEATLTIPSDITLLIPYKEDDSFSTSITAKAPSDVTAVGTDPNYDAKFNKLASNLGDTKLTIAGGVTLVNAGTIYVDAKLLVETGGNAEACFPDKDNCGVLELENGSKIETTGSLYAYGVIRGVDESGTPVNGRGADGEGEIDVKGGNVTEVFTILDFHGGSDLANCVSEKFVTPFHNWQVDNIRVKTTFLHGAKYNAFGCIYASNTKASIDVILADKNADSNPLFVMQNSNTIIQKTYGNGYELNVKSGNVIDGTTTFEISSGTPVVDAFIDGFGTVDFTKVAMPLPNFDLVISEEATVTLNSNVYKLLPGSDVTVYGTLNIDTKLAIYESFERKTENGGDTPRKYPSDWKPATLTVNGTVNLNNSDNDKTALAGEIIPGSKDAVINVKGAVGQPNFSEGYTASDVWYPTSIAGQPSQAVLNGVELSLTKGEIYTVKTESALGKTYYTWVK